MKLVISIFTLVAVSQFGFAKPVDLMTFNIRYGTADDGVNSWEFRKDLVIETIRNANPGAIAIQEALLSQLEYIDAQLPEIGRAHV